MNTVDRVDKTLVDRVDRLSDLVDRALLDRALLDIICRSLVKEP